MEVYIFEQEVKEGDEFFKSEFNINELKRLQSQIDKQLKINEIEYSKKVIPQKAKELLKKYSEPNQSYLLRNPRPQVIHNIMKKVGCRAMLNPIYEENYNQSWDFQQDTTNPC